MEVDGGIAGGLALIHSMNVVSSTTWLNPKTNFPAGEAFGLKKKKGRLVVS